MMKYTITTVLFLALLNMLQAPFTFEWTGPNGYTSTEKEPADITEAGSYELAVPKKAQPATKKLKDKYDGLKPHDEVDIVNIGADNFYKYFQDGNFTDAEIEGYLKFAGDFDNPIDQRKLKSQPSLAVLWKKNKDGDPDFCALSLTSGTTPVEVRSSGCDGIDLNSMIKKLPDPDTDAGVAFWSKYEEVFINDHFDADGILDFDATQKVDEFLKDLQKEGDDFLQKFVDDPDLMEAWEVLENMVDDIGPSWKTDVPTLNKLSEDIGTFPDLENFLKTNPDHFDAWNSIKYLSSNTRGNPITIQRFKEQLEDYAVYNDPGTSAIAKRNTYKGHTDGFANSSGGRGGHFPEDVGTISSDGKIIIVDETQPTSLDSAPFSATEVPMSNLPVNNDGVALATGNKRVYIAQYVMDGNQNPTNVISRYRPKSTGADHTFFPPGMEWDEIMEQFSSALANPNKANWGGQSSAWEAAAENGMMFRWYDGQKTVFLKH
jgi:hypothetical protein